MNTSCRRRLKCPSARVIPRLGRDGALRRPDAPAVRPYQTGAALIIVPPLGVPRLYVFSAKGAASLFSLGQRPKIREIPSASAESAIHFRH